MPHLNSRVRRPAVVPEILSPAKPAVDAVRLPTLGRPHPKGYRAKVGGKRFWLGRDPEQAQALLINIAAEWRVLTNAGAAEWSADALARIEQFKSQQRDATAAHSPKVLRATAAPTRRQQPVPVAFTPDQAAPRQPETIPPAPHQMLRLYAAIENYLERRRGDVRAGL